MNIAPLNPDTPAARALIDRLDAYQIALYPAESNHLDDIAALQMPNVLFLGAYIDAELVGCGAVKRLDDDGIYGEIKRVFVLDAYRGRGVSKRLMHELEAHLLAAGIHTARLETGIRQPEAIALYRRLGYRERGPYGAYAADPLSLFMEKRLGGGSAVCAP
jgi:putative acetyltransferase